MAVIFNIQRFCVQDGPGIRTTVFFKGCPLRCQWCSNPESQNDCPEVAHRNSLCNKCGRCFEICPPQAISMIDEGVAIDRNKCNNCGKCVEVCIPEALKVYGKEMSIDEVYQDVVRDKPFYQNSGGGVTASGGEPLANADFVAELFKRCRDAGIHTCIETCGYATAGSWDKVLPYTDLVLYDLKLMDDPLHRKMTGQSNEKIMQNLRHIVDRGVPIIIRIPVIPGINDTKENLIGTARFVADRDGLKSVNLLQYHRFGESKYAMLDRKYELEKLEPQEFSQLEELKSIFKSFNLDCEVVK
jgi:pyruvate formate lyase activating enzyme